MPVKTPACPDARTARCDVAAANVTSRDVDGELGDDGVLTNLEMLAGIGIPRIAPGVSLVLHKGPLPLPPSS